MQKFVKQFLLFEDKTRAEKVSVAARTAIRRLIVLWTT